MTASRRKWLVAGAGMLFIVSAIAVNPLIPYSCLSLGNGQKSLLRCIIVGMYDILAIWGGIFLIVKRNDLVVSVRKIVFTVILIFLLGCLTEVLLQILVRVNSTIGYLLSNCTVELHFPDEKFGFVLNPEYPGIDSNGFRNSKSLKSADIVAMGDSFTYGVGVSGRQSWPSQLQRISGQSVYNMGKGGYGSIEALMLVDKAIPMEPSWIVFATYNGNDLVDAFRAVYDRQIYSEFKTDDPAVRDELSRLEETDHLFTKIKKLTGVMWASPYSEQNQTENADKPKQMSLSPGKQVKDLKILRLFYAVERVLQKTFIDTRARRFEWEKQHPDSVLHELFETPKFKTLFTPAYRHLAMNLEDPRIEEGLKISQKAIKQMNETAKSHSIQYLVLMIPTKERAFYELYPEYGMKPSESMYWLVQQENQIRERMLSFFQKNQISYIDLLPVLKDCFKREQQPYFEDNDGHFNPVGQAAAAEAVNHFIKQQMSSEKQVFAN